METDFLNKDWALIIFNLKWAFNPGRSLCSSLICSPLNLFPNLNISLKLSASSLLSPQQLSTSWCSFSKPRKWQHSVSLNQLVRGKKAIYSFPTLSAQERRKNWTCPRPVLDSIPIHPPNMFPFILLLFFISLCIRSFSLAYICSTLLHTKNNLFLTPLQKGPDGVGSVG